MTPDARGLPAFALLASGASFSCAVLRALIRRNCRPRLLVLPAYPPAPVAGEAGIELAANAGPEILRLAGETEIGYAPEARQRESAAMLSALGIEFLLVACWPYRIERELCASAAGAALNLHPSLLPNYRGPDPLQQQLAAGDRRFGVTLHLLDERFDHGDIVAQAKLVDAGGDAEAKAVEWRCAELGALLFVDALSAWPDWKPVPQASLEPPSAGMP